MTTFFTLWDIESGTSLGTYATEDDVLANAHALIVANDFSYADTLELGYQDDFGLWRAIASGATLAARAQDAMTGATTIGTPN